MSHEFKVEGEIAVSASRRVRRVIWVTVILGVAVSLAANIVAAPRLGWQPVLVAGWPPVALLLAVGLLSQLPVSRPLKTVRK